MKFPHCVPHIIILFILQVKLQQGVPSQPSNFRTVETRATSITLEWDKPSHSGDNIVSYELYWNDTFSGDVSKLRYLVLCLKACHKPGSSVDFRKIKNFKANADFLKWNHHNVEIQEFVCHSDFPWNQYWHVKSQTKCPFWHCQRLWNSFSEYFIS